MTKPKDKQSLLADVEKLLGKEARDIADQLFDGIAELGAAYKEAKRRDRWRQTYNAVLGRIGFFDNDLLIKDKLDEFHLMASLQADRAHGPLDKEKPAPLPEEWQKQRRATWENSR